VPNKQLLQTPQTLVEGAHVLRHVRQPRYAAQQSGTPLGCTMALIACS
jgi:hypothetical protein